MLIYKTENFSVLAAEHPHIDRLDGGHVKIVPKVRVRDRTKLSPELAMELMKLSMVVGEAMTLGLRKRGIDIGRINYQDNGNWRVFDPNGPYLHIHLYGRAISASTQKYGDAIHLPHRESGFYENLVPLDSGDVEAIRSKIERILKTPKFSTTHFTNTEPCGQGG